MIQLYHQVQNISIDSASAHTFSVQTDTVIHFYIKMYTPALIKEFDNIIPEHNPENPFEKYKAAIYLCSLWGTVRVWMENGMKESPEMLADFIISETKI